MSESHAVCLFTEGRITLPDQYQDRTVNVFTLAGENAPHLTSPAIPSVTVRLCRTILTARQR